MGFEQDAQVSLEQDTEWKRIWDFMTRRRAEVLFELKRSGRLSQGELARRINAKPTALANLLMKFDGFSPALLKKDYEGKYCYYTLTEWGQRYVEKGIGDGHKKATSPISLQDREDAILFSEAKESLSALESRYGEEWQTVFDDLLVHYLRNGRSTLDGDAKQLVNRYLRSLELLTIHQNERLCNETLALLSNPILSNRVVEFMDQFFEPLSIILKTLQDKSLTTPVGRALRFIFTGRKDQSTENDLKHLNWTESTIRSLDSVAKKIRAAVAGYTSEDIDEFFSALLPDQEMLCVLIRQLLLEA